MNSKELKSQKKVKKSKLNLKNGGQQVFVLPPNLLQKLGINLGNMETTTNSQDMELKIPTCISNDEYGHSSSNPQYVLNSNTIQNETSIIKTANLMKESVFLSPTFNTVNLSNSTSSQNEECVKATNTEHHCTSEKTQKVLVNKVNSSNITSEYDLLNNRKQNHSYNDSECDMDLSIQNNVSQINGSTASEKPLSRTETKKVISIISEETVSVAKLNELKVLQMPAKNTMIPASLKTLIGKKVSKKSITQSETVPTLAKVIPDTIDIKVAGSKDKLTENTVNLDIKIHCNTENFYTSNSSLEVDEQVSENYKEETILNKSVENNNSEIMLKKSIDCNTENITNSNILETNIQTSQNTKEEIASNINEIILIKSMDCNTENFSKSNKEEAILNRSFDSNNCEIILKEVLDCDTKNFCNSNNILETIKQVSQNNEEEKILNRTCGNNNSGIIFKESIDCSTENFCNTKNIIEIDNHVSQKNEVFDSNKSDEMLKKCTDHAIVESNLDLIPSQNEFGITSDHVSKESMFTDIDTTHSIQSLISNNHNQKQPTNVTCPLLINHSYDVDQVDNSDSIKMNDSKQKVINDLSQIMNANNNTWDHNESYIPENDVVLLDDSHVDDDVDDIDIPISDHHNISNVCEPGFIDISIEKKYIMSSPKKCTTFTLQESEEPSITKELTLDINGDYMMSSSESLKTPQRETFYNTIDDEVDNKLSLPLNPKKNNSISKLCIQGVEKPGGFNTDTQRNVSLKTYSKNNKYKLHRKSLSPGDLNFNVKFDHNFNIDLNETRPVDLFDIQQFCKCCDYGILDYSQLGKSYEHIHFTTKISLDCSPNIIFGIYDNEVMNIEQHRENLDQTEDVTDQTDTGYTGHNICWSNADSELIEYQTQVSTLNTPEDHPDLKSHSNPLLNTMNMKVETRADKECDLKNDINICNKMEFQNQSRKRKNSDNCVEVTRNKRAKHHKVAGEIPIQTQHDEKLEHGFKGWERSNSTEQGEHQDDANDQHYVKCAVCSKDVLNSTWSTHIASEHAYLAWKEGEAAVNLEDEDEIKYHLHNIVQELGQLECRKCGLTRKYAKPFLHHIRSCWSSDTTNGAQLLRLSKINEAQTTRNCDNCGHKCNNTTEYKAHTKKCTNILLLPGLRTRRSINEDPTTVTCGVCKEELMSNQWITHIQEKHNYRAWPEGDPPLNFEDQAILRKHLYVIQQNHGPLICSKCFKAHKYVKLFLQHIESCTGIKESDDPLATFCAEWESILDKSLDVSGVESTRLVKCGQCQQEMESKDWISHIKDMHNYVSWQEGTSPIDTSDNEAVWRYLSIVVRKLGTMVCPKCGTARKYAKRFLSHVDNCTGILESDMSNIDNTLELDNTVADSSQHLNTSSQMSINDSQGVPDPTVKCGVCQKEMNNTNWITHISMNHEYLAWKETDTPIDVSNYKAISQHLTNIIKDIGSLKCAECGRRSKYAKAFLVHIKICYGKSYVPIEVDNHSSDSDMEASNNKEETTKCGVCGQEMGALEWRDHLRTQHNYLAWRVGDAALDLDDDEMIGSHLKSILRATGQLTCAKCGYVRKQPLVFYAHIKTCEGPTESSGNSNSVLDVSEKNVKCAVCLAEVANASWIDHIAKEHDYMAWKDGDHPLNMEDATSIKEHLYQISSIAGGLICNKCGESRKYVKSYLQHVRACTISQESVAGTPNKAPEIQNEATKIVMCALCGSEMDDCMWMDHIAKEHNYVSWKKNEPPLEFKDEKALRDHLYNIVQSIGCLTCSNCGSIRKYAKTYLQHIESCQRVTWESINKIISKSKRQPGDIVSCAVCHAEVDDTEWLRHIASQHNYLAWRQRDPAINLENEDDVLRHLKNIIHEEGYLECYKCNLRRKYAKLYLQHVNNCKGVEEDGDEINDTLDETKAVSVEDTDESAIVKCGVCAQEVVRSQWIPHIQKEHKYIAWEEGQEPIDVNNKEALHSHLYAINMKCNGLTCDLCGAVRKYVKAYLHHVRDCKERVYVDSNEIVECGVCKEKVPGPMWRDHAMKTHYNIAWIEGDTPINLRNFFNVDKYLKEYQQKHNKLVCKICGLSRVSLAGFYAHIFVCGKTEEEVEKLKDVCEICNQKYICLYKSQHYWTHRVKDMAKERKIQETLKKEEEKIKEDPSPGRRKAAQKARNVIGVYAAKLGSHKCKSCAFETDCQEELDNHNCFKYPVEFNEDSDDSMSIKLEDFSEEESEDTTIEDELSNDEERGSNVVKKSRRRVRKPPPSSKMTTKTSKFPFEVDDAKEYLEKCAAEHFELFYMKETLLPNMRESTYEIVPAEQMSQYMPQLAESCKVSISNGKWKTYGRFESGKENGCMVVFTGGSIQCMSWAPEGTGGAGGGSGGAVLAVGTHRGADAPRLQPADTPAHAALLQIWDFGDFTTLPKLAFGLALDYGTVWAMDWCPSGARDLPDTIGPDGSPPRLGLLAVACSNGSAYVLSVPYPDTTPTSELTFYKVKPCVELRLSRGSNKYQATSVNWTLFKGYTTISVGYGDGTVALYDLATESPLLTAKEGGLNILYPYQDERVHNSSVTGLTSCLLGAWCSSSVTGSTAGVAAAGRPLRAHAALAAAAPAFMPHWPNVMLAGDDTIVGLSPSELEWGNVGRRMGSVRALAACERRACVAALVPPLLQAMRPHPAAFRSHKAIHKKNLATIDMVPLAKKRSKHTNDKLSMKLEPLDYESAITSYGIEFKFEKDFDKSLTKRMQQKQRVPYPERFPLADVPALAYCPLAAHPAALALATHAGLLLQFDA